jgi:uncharacterized protein YbaP (TraB family)
MLKNKVISKHLFMKKIISLVALLLLFVVSSQAQLLWKISGKGLSQPSYMFGTHHLAKLDILDSIKGIKPAFESVKQVIGEIDMKEMSSPSTMQKMQQKMMIDNDTTLTMLLSKEEYAKVDKCIQEYIPGVSLSMMPKVRPAFLTNQLSVVMMMKQLGETKLEEQMDTHFQQEALAKGKKVAAFETIDQQIDILLGAPLRRQAELLVCLIDNIKDEAKKALELSAYYKHQKIDAMYKISQERDGTRCDSYPSEEAKLIYDRNDAWVAKIPAMIKENPSMIVVGALHLPGPKGLIAQLRKAGYTVTPVK